MYIVPFKEGQKKVKNGEYDVEKYELPTIQVREQMCDYLESSDNENNLREYGGAIWEYEDDSQNQELRCASPGPIWSGGSYGSIDVMEYGNDEYNASEKKTLTYFHSHFSGKINGIGLKQWPSDAFDGDPHDFKRGDIQNVLNEQGGRMGGARLPYNIMVAMRDKKVFLYTQHGVKCIMDINLSPMNKTHPCALCRRQRLCEQRVNIEYSGQQPITAAYLTDIMGRTEQVELSATAPSRLPPHPRDPRRPPPHRKAPQAKRHLREIKYKYPFIMEINIHS